MNLPHQKNAGYGSQWWCNSLDLEGRTFDCYFASGNGGNKIYVIPSLDMVVAMASSAYRKPYMHLRSFEALRQIVFAAI